MASELMPAIALLERELEDVERNANTLRNTINLLRSKAGMPPLTPNGGGGGGSGGGASITEIQPDTFYGKRLQTAVREYLEMRKAAGLGPATPRQIYDAVTEGGYQFEAASAEIALVGLRAMLRKRSQFFHKLPNGNYGLTAWYPHAKTPKGSAKPEADDDDDEDQDTDTETAADQDDPDDAAVA